MRTRFLFAVTMLVSLALFLPPTAQAMGATDNSASYRSELATVFNDTIEKLYKNEISLSEAKQRLKDIRIRYRVSYTDESGIIDSMMDRAAEGTLTVEEAVYYFQLLQENRLGEYRETSYRSRFELHQQKLLGLLVQHIESAGPEGVTAAELRSIMNNYYDLFGLRYGSEYKSLSRLILSFEEGSVSVERLTSELSSMETQLAGNGSGNTDNGNTGARASNGAEGKQSGAGGNSSSSSGGENAGRQDSSGGSGGQGPMKDSNRAQR